VATTQLVFQTMSAALNIRRQRHPLVLVPPDDDHLGRKGTTVDRTKKEQSVRERILATALDVIRESDGRELSSRRVARLANVNAAMINYHFKNREGLMQACVETYYADIRSLLSGLRTQLGSTPFPILADQAVRLSLAYARKNRPLARLVLLDFVRSGQAREQPRSTEEPMVRAIVSMLATQLAVSETEVRFRIKSIALLCGRYVVLRDEELLRISDCTDIASGWSHLDDHLAGMASMLLCPPKSTT